MNRVLFSSIFIFLLASCSSSPARFSGSTIEYGPNRERQIFYALTLVKADDGQRAAILASFDDTDPQLKALAEESATVQQQLQQLDAKQSDYLAAIEPLARKRGDMDAARLMLQARFTQTVAVTLGPDQRKEWSKIFRSFSERPTVETDDRDDERPDQSGGGRRRRGG